MAHLWTKFKDALLGVDVEDDFDDDEDEYDYEDENEIRPYKNNPAFNRAGREQRSRGSAQGTIVGGPQLFYGNSTRRAEENDSFETRPQVRICHPKSMEEASHIVKNIKDGAVSLVDLSETLQDDALMCQRIADFLGGSAFALEGEIIRHNDSILIVAPKGADVSQQELVKELKNRGINFSPMDWI